MSGGQGNGAIGADAVETKEEAGGTGTERQQTGPRRGARGGAAQAQEPGTVHLRW